MGKKPSKPPKQRNAPADRGTLSQRTAQKLRELIIAGKLKPGERLAEVVLSERLGVSRVPFREALRLLESDGLVTIEPRRGAHVTVLDPHERRVIAQIDRLIDRELVRAAVPRLSSLDLERAAELADAMERTPDSWKWAELNLEFHRVLNAPASMPVLQRMSDRLARLSLAYLMALLRVRGVRNDLNAEHRLLLAAYRTRDPERAISVLEQHLSRGANPTDSHAPKRRSSPSRSSKPSPKKGRRKSPPSE